MIHASGLSKDTRLLSDAVSKSREKSRIEAAMVARSAYTYADFLLPHLQLDMIVLDLGCGQATISIGLSETVPNGRVVGVDIDRYDLAVGRRNAAAMDRGNLAFAAADGRRLPFGDHLCHSVLETLSDAASVLVELRRIIRRGGVIGAASVEYGGIIFGGAETAGPQRFHDIRQRLWRAEGIAEPNTGRHLRGLLQRAGFSRVEASAKYISYGTKDRIIAFARDRAAECRGRWMRTLAARHGIASAEELALLAASWEEWGRDPEAFFAFPWCQALAWR